MGKLTQAQLSELFGTIFDQLALEHGLENDEVSTTLRTLFIEAAVFDKRIGNDWYTQLDNTDWVQACDALNPKDKIVGLIFLSTISDHNLRERIDAVGYKQEDSYTFLDRRLEAATRLLERLVETFCYLWLTEKLPYSGAQALTVFSMWSSGAVDSSWMLKIDLKAFLHNWTPFIRADESAYRSHLQTMRKRFSEANYITKKYRLEIVTAVDSLLTDPSHLHPALDPDGWGDAMLEWINASSNQSAVSALLAKLNKTAGKTPSEQWLSEIRALADSFDLKEYKALCFGGLERFLRGSSDPVKFKIGDKNKGILTAFAWSLLWFQDDPRVTGLLSDVAVTGFRKLSGAGVRAEKVAMAATWVLSQLEGIRGVSGLLRVQSVLRGRQLTVMQKIFDPVMERFGLSEDDLLESAAPDFGLHDERVRLEAGDAWVELHLFGREVITTWFSSDGQPRSQPSSAVKRSQPDVVKNAKRLASEIEGQLRLFTDRFENAYLPTNETQDWTFQRWTERYVQHPFLTHFARTLIWQFTTENARLEGRWADGQLIGADGQPLETLPDSAGVRLWHPLHSTSARVLEWRSQLERQQIRQPFKQAHREVYVLTDAERRTQTYSNRFAAHIMRQFQFGKLCQVRGWEFNAYSPDVATLEWPEYGLHAEFWISSSDGEHVVSDQLRFCDAGGAISLEGVPAVVFSETMRDLDLFVAASSVGNDPNWFDAGPEQHRAYWQSYSFGELSENAQSRKQLLEMLLPQLNIRERARLEGRFLHVRGELREYKIHLGSGNILMLPNDQYLCIVPKSSAANPSSDIQLPFEGDQTLAVILSKAFMLADDNNIKDETITQQIKE